LEKIPPKNPKMPEIKPVMNLIKPLIAAAPEVRADDRSDT
jgi:hypothetical protein